MALIDCSGRVAVVTGGTRGIGAAISRDLLEQGGLVVAVYAGNDEAAATFAASLGKARDRLSLRKADIGDPATCRDIVAAALASHGRLDYLVNNAGLLIENSVRKMTAEEWDQAIAVNLSASFHLGQAALVPMLEQGFGRIVNISSVTAVMGNPIEAGYAAAKAGLHGLTRAMALATARKGVTVNVVIPGIFETDMTNGMDPAVQDQIKAMIPLGRRGQPSELSHAVMFLLDDRAGYITGSIITVDGGLSMGA
jgi:NAD(P)-dependent dehydrogenase (short-subunit alcohol dehydrogenase family)